MTDPFALTQFTDHLIALAPQIALGFLAFVGVMAVFVRMAWPR